MKKTSKRRTALLAVALHRLVSWHCYDGGLWVRILGRGLSVVNKQKYSPLFSERNGYRRVLRMGKLGVEYLPLDV